MAEVLRSNFDKIIPKVVEQIHGSTFVAIDAEYTGLFSPNLTDQNSLFDTPSRRYQKLRNGFANFQISQFGLAIFTKVWDKNEYLVESYNFYLYPVSFHTFRDRASFMCQTSSINFLAYNNFDFNKFIKEGTPYLRPDETESLRKYLKSHRHFMTDVEYRDKAYFPRFSRELDDEQIEDIVDHLTGFSKVVQAIHNSRKPVVGHNMLLDLILLYQQFCSPLPDSYEQFKSEIHKLFPIIFDTKNVVSKLRKAILERRSKNVSDAEMMFDTSLLLLYKNLHSIKNFFGPVISMTNPSMKYSKEMEIIFRQTSGNNENPNEPSSHYHEAAFDACVTGGVFLFLSHVSFRQTSHCPTTCAYTTTAVELFSFLAGYENELNIVRATCNFISLEGADPLSNRPNWIRVENAPNRSAKMDITWLRAELPRLGDVDIEMEPSGSILLACGGWGSARNVWTLLKNRGFELTALEHVPDASERNWLSASSVVKALICGAGFGFILRQGYLHLKKS